MRLSSAIFNRRASLSASCKSMAVLFGPAAVMAASDGKLKISEVGVRSFKLLAKMLTLSFKARRHLSPHIFKQAGWRWRRMLFGFSDRRSHLCQLVPSNFVLPFATPPSLFLQKLTATQNRVVHLPPFFLCSRAVERRFI